MDETAATRDSDGSARRPAESAKVAGDLLAGRYKLEAEIGKGGFGVVFLARDTRLDKRIAVKVLSSGVAQTPASLSRFKLEAIAAARVGHKGIVDVTDVGEDDDGTHFIVMEYIEGTDLGLLLRSEHTLPLSRALCIGARIAQALAAAHQEGIIHRDLKPGNVLLTSLGSVVDFVKILDFGVSKIVDHGPDRDHLTQDGQVIGTPRYMAPEQGLGDQAIDARVDIYALGTILYEMVTGQVPYSGSSNYEVIHNKLSVDPLPPAVVNPDIQAPLAFEELVLRALARQPDQRFATMAEFELAIRDLLAVVDPAALSAVKPATPTSQPRIPDGLPTPSASVSTQVSKQPSRQPFALTPTSKVNDPPPPTRVTAPEPTRRTRLAVLVVAIGAVAGLAILGIGKLRAPAPAAPSPAPASAVVPEPAVPPAPEVVEIRFVVQPPGARLEIDGLAVAGDQVTLPRSDRTHEVVVSAPGFQSARRTFQALLPGELEITLQAEPAPVPPPDKPPRRPRPRKPDPRLPDSPL